MRVAGLQQPPYNTTMLGVVKGALDYYGLDMSPAMAFGGSGHAFLINIHDQLCPSGPYCWRGEPFFGLVRNLGLEMTDLGFFHTGSTAAERAAIEVQLRQALDEGDVCSLLNMENQLILGHDERQFATAKPWPGCVDFPPATLTYGTWAELGDEVHVNFFRFRAAPRMDQDTTIRAALGYAVDLFRRPEEHSLERYGIGPRAYDNWIQAVDAYGSSHGNWWNATVWSECRQMASEFFAEIGGQQAADVAEASRELSADYASIAALLARASDKELPAAEKATIVKDLKSREIAAVERVEALLARLG